MMLDNDEGFERTVLYRLFANLFMNKPTHEVLVLVKDMFRIKSDETPDLIEIDFAHIFPGPLNRLPPYESLYEKYIPGESGGAGVKITDGLRSFYASAGLMMDAGANLLPDHLSTELLFMSYLTENDLVEHQRRFLEEHLFRWVPGYCDEMCRHAATSFFKEIANLLKEFILSECGQFGIDFIKDGG